MAGKGSGYGKTILFGEHFVVYGVPALASAIGDATTCIVESVEGMGYELNDDRPEVPGYKEKKFEEQEVSIKNVLDFMGINLEEKALRITFGGDLVCASGVGASAASCVSLARAINEEFSLGWDDEKINDAAYEGEKGYHGTPSGIDNTASTFGGLVYFIKNLEGGPNTIETVKLKKPIELVIASSGMTANTAVVVGDVRKKKEENPEWFDGVVKEYLEVIKEGRQALENMDLERVGHLMNKNHELLQQITVSNNVLDKMVQLARDNGAQGAKLTGTGRGGNIIALTPSSELQDKVFNALKDAGYPAWKTLIGV
ncbi:MAG: mevalonate kinase [Candidatus Heimdallarchaeota archaeon]|nr:MAG: mevalonate kinase [Candidatus Heimdallarchaeota archaeon]